MLTVMDKTVYVRCERCGKMTPQLYTCGPGGKWRYCGNCFSKSVRIEL